MREIAPKFILAVLFCGWGAVAVYGGIFGLRQTYDTSEGVNPLSAILVSDADLRSASACASDVIGTEMRQGLSPTRSRLFYAEWRCDIAARKNEKPNT